MNLELNASEYTVTVEGITVKLLPKEFALMRFLYRNRGRTFSREQLLDKVWPLEYPVERTVDDHIYRLRKKLDPFADLEIKTVRGYGYSLVVQIAKNIGETNPTTRDLELHETMRDVIGKYHQYGQGRSMLTLARQQDVLGYELDPFYSVYVRFVQGDLEWLLHTDEVSLDERFYWLLLFYMFTGSPKQRLTYCEQVLKKNLLSPAQHKEMEILNILDLYALAEEPDKAMERLKVSHALIAEPDYENFIPQTAITEMFVHLIAGAEEDELEKMAETIEAEILSAKPFLREIGSYKVVKGIWRLQRQAWLAADDLLEEGLQVLGKSGFVPMKLHALYRINHYCGLFPPIKELKRKYSYIFEEEQERIGLKKLLGSLEATMLNKLNRF
ncbi:winged helix-turn-helix domain-containing protein [Paenibacillus spongiae]|uniref:Winged helix-turn-helix domain-containing protein n=1 Tax=Paenibacillus spongiae TaxID=2909671 RepID=A0ABY5SHB9_9BACL|nr:winged helix-turn-helix domain-containing protein [Paenibacillus spongiae]UVI33397.1 winged helix-turn-helix domain-containing protein [Paenibacillus spongiae]